MIVGHEEVLSVLEQDLPPVTLLRGPHSVGKRTIADHLAKHHKIHRADYRRVLKLTADEARDVRRFVSTAPMGTQKLVFIRLNSNETALNALLKTLEEPPARARFILSSTEAVLPTVESRSQVFPCGLLTEEQLYQVLVSSKGMDEDKALRVAAAGHGQVRRALELGLMDSSRASVLSVLKAVHDRDSAMLASATQKWDDSAHALLRRWCVEAITGRWQSFSELESFGLQREPDVVRGMLQRLTTINARPKLAVRVALDQACSRR